MLRPVYHGEHGLRTLRELGRSYQTLSQDLNRVMGSKRWLGRTEFLTLTIQSEPRLETRKPSTRAKWRSFMSASGSVLEMCLTPPTLLEIAMFTPTMLDRRRCEAQLEQSADRRGWTRGSFKAAEYLRLCHRRPCYKAAERPTQHLGKTAGQQTGYAIPRALWWLQIRSRDPLAARMPQCLHPKGHPSTSHLRPQLRQIDVRGPRKLTA
jgi:hypothetical protein